MSTSSLIDKVKLPTLSKTLLKIIEVEKLNPISFLDDIKRIIERDPLFSAHLMQVANSSFYGFTQKVRTLPHAIGLADGALIIEAKPLLMALFQH